VMNFVFRKTGLVVRIYCDYVGDYVDSVESLPEPMIKAIEKAPTCKRFNNPPHCNPKCIGYIFKLNGIEHKKCRYNCFLLPVNEENIPIIKSLTENEIKIRKSQI